MQKDAEKTKQKHAKEVSTIKRMSMDALQEADSKIQDIEHNLEKEREEHRALVKVLEEDAMQVRVITINWAIICLACSLVCTTISGIGLSHPCPPACQPPDTPGIVATITMSLRGGYWTCSGR